MFNHDKLQALLQEMRTAHDVYYASCVNVLQKYGRESHEYSIALRLYYLNKTIVTQLAQCGDASQMIDSFLERETLEECRTFLRDIAAKLAVIQEVVVM